jgi:hypothetical protein
MGFLGMTVATINQSFPAPPARLVLGSKFGYVLCFYAQPQIVTHLVKGLAHLKAEQQTFQVLGFLTHGWRMEHRNLLDSGRGS